MCDGATAAKAEPAGGNEPPPPCARETPLGDGSASWRERSPHLEPGRPQHTRCTCFQQAVQSQPRPEPSVVSLTLGMIIPTFCGSQHSPIIQALPERDKGDPEFMMLGDRCHKDGGMAEMPPPFWLYPGHLFQKFPLIGQQSCPASPDPRAITLSPLLLLTFHPHDPSLCPCLF